MDDSPQPAIPTESTADDDTVAARNGGARVAENLARIGVALGCERVELYGVTTDDTVRLDAWWASLDHPNPSIPPNAEPIPLSWFPWNLGNVFALHYMFVRNADALMSHPNDPLEVGDLGFASVLHVALKRSDRPLGSICCFWAEERPDPGEWSWSAIVELGLDALYRIT
jgi:hypothetical protein